MKLGNIIDLYNIRKDIEPHKAFALLTLSLEYNRDTDLKHISLDIDKRIKIANEEIRLGWHQEVESSVLIPLNKKKDTIDYFLNIGY